MTLAVPEKLYAYGAAATDRGNSVLTVVVSLSGAMVLLLGLTVLAGWHTHNAAIMRILPSLPVMKYNTALTFALCGAGVLATVFGRPRPALFAALPAGLIGGLTLVEFGFGVDLKLDQLFMRDNLEPELLYPGRMALSTAACFVLSAGAVILLNSKTVSRRQAAVAGIMATVVLALGASGLMRYLSGLDMTYDEGDVAHMALHTTLGFMALGIGLLLFSTGPGSERRLAAGPAWLPAAACVMMIVITVGFWRVVDTARDLHLNDTFRVETRLAKILLTTYMVGSIEALERMAKRWERRGAMPREEWEADALAYSEDYPAIQAIQWISPSLQVQWVVPQAGNETVRGLDLGFAGEDRRALEQARTGRTMTMTSQIDLAQGGIGFVIYVPVYVKSDFQGYISTVFRTADFVNRVIPAEFMGGHHLRIQAGNTEIYATPDTVTQGEEAWQQVETISLPGAVWRLTVIPKQALLLKKMTRLPAIVLLMGLFLTILVSLTLRLYQTARRGETSSLQKEALLSTVVNNLEEGVVVSDLDGQILHFNPASIQMHGFTGPDEYLCHMTEFTDTFELAAMDGAVRAAKQWPLARILRGEKLYDLEVRIRRIRADWHRIFSYGGTLVYDPDGNPMLAILTVRDITERKQAENEILKLNEELEHRVRLRTAQLETVNKELDAFSYSISHDLRAPIRHISGFIDLLGEAAGAALDDKARRYLVLIRDSAGRMGELIDDLLSFSRTGRDELKLTQVNLRRLVDETVVNLKPEAENRRIDWRIADLPEALGDCNMLRVVLTNLLSNALKFTNRRELAEISIGALHGDGKEAVIFVRDNGAGFDMKYVNKLFGVFQRLHRREEFDGTGIGLAIVSRIISRHGGRVWAESALDAGACFYFTLPKTEYR